MSIQLTTECILCHLKRHIEKARTLGDEATATAFAKELMQHILDTPEGDSSATLGPKAAALYRKYYGLEEDRYRQEKADSNRFVLERMDTIRSRIAQAADPLYGALQFSVLGNYMDFSALAGKVSFQQLEEMLNQAEKMELDPETYQAMKQDMEKGTRLLYLTDNAGEICFDRILGEEIQKHYPHLQITFCVRGGPAHNDATREDAQLVGIPFPVIDNGNTVGGTELRLLSSEAKQAIEDADLIIAKGMGNTETLYGCGYNIYYAFLVKCNQFARVFGKPLMTPMLVKERK